MENSYCMLLTWYYSDKIKEDERGWAYSTHEDEKL